MFSNIRAKTSSKTIDEYADDYPTFLLSDLKTVKESILKNTKYVQNISGEDNKKPLRSKIDTKKSLPNNWDDIDNLIFGIRDNDQLINTLTSYKKQKIGMGYIHIESSQYISVIIKRPQKYPLVVIRIPVEPPFVYVNNDFATSGCLFNFPTESIYGKDTSSKSKNKQYRLYLRKQDNEFILTLETIINNDIKKTEIRNITSHDNSVLCNNINATMPRYLNCFSLSKFDDITLALNEMNITIVKKLPNNKQPINFDILMNKQQAFLVFEDDKLDFVIKGEYKNDRQTILTKADADYWPKIDYNNTKYVLHDYDQLFKLTHYDIKTTKNGIYYILSSFLNAHMFTILITDQNVMINEENRVYTFQDIFNKGTQILEMYLLIEDKDELE